MRLAVLSPEGISSHLKSFRRKVQRSLPVDTHWDQFGADDPSEKRNSRTISAHGSAGVETRRCGKYSDSPQIREIRYRKRREREDFLQAGNLLVYVPGFGGALEFQYAPRPFADKETQRKSSFRFRGRQCTGLSRQAALRKSKVLRKINEPVGWPRDQGGSRVSPLFFDLLRADRHRSRSAISLRRRGHTCCVWASRQKTRTRVVPSTRARRVQRPFLFVLSASR